MTAKEFITQDELTARLRASVNDAGSISAWASANGVSRSWVCNMLRGRVTVGSAVPERLGYRRVVVYAPMDSSSDAQPENVRTA